MRRLHQSAHLLRWNQLPRQLRLDSAQRIALAHGGWLQVDAGQVWLTRDGGGEDTVLAAGDSLWLGRGQQVVVEPWRRGQPAQLAWRQPQPGVAPKAGQAGVGLGLGLTGRWPWAGLAWALRRGGAALLAAARSAEARASRAQGAMPGGESMASSGALQ